MVSNRDQTAAALTRWEYGSRLIEEGLKFDGYGKCFDNIVNNPQEALGTVLSSGLYVVILGSEPNLEPKRSNAQRKKEDKSAKESFEVRTISFVFVLRIASLQHDCKKSRR